MDYRPLIWQLCSVAGSEVKDLDVDIRDLEERKFASVMSLTLAKCDGLDTEIHIQTKFLQSYKTERQFYVAVMKANWQLLKPLKQKYREIADDAMELMDEAVKHNFLEEGDYLARANDFKSDLETMAGVIRHLELAKVM